MVGIGGKETFGSAGMAGSGGSVVGCGMDGKVGCSGRDGIGGGDSGADVSRRWRPP